jgi:hypothetical protein
MSRFTLDSASEFLFGHCMHALSGALPFPHNARPSSTPSPSLGGSVTEATGTSEFAQAFLDAQVIIANRERYGWVWPLREIWGDMAKKPMEVVNMYLAPIIRDAIRKKEEAKAVAVAVAVGE